MDITLPEGKAKALEATGYDKTKAILGIRPEDMHDEEAFVAAQETSVVSAYVDVTEMMGAEYYLYLTIADKAFTARVNPRTTAKVGDTIKIAFDVNKIHLFDKETELTIIN